MVSAVLRSDVAVQVSIQIMDAFVEMRKLIANHSGLLQRMDGVERKLLETDQKFEQVKRNIERFPESFRFQLREGEMRELVANCDRFETLKHASSNLNPESVEGIMNEIRELM